MTEIENAIEKNVLESQDIVEMCELALKIIQIEDPSNTDNKKKFLKKIIVESGKTNNKLEKIYGLERILKLEKSDEIYFELIDSLLEIGEVEKAEKYSVNCYKKLAEKKNFREIEALYKLRSKKCATGKIDEDFFIASLIQSNDIERVKSQVSSNVNAIEFVAKYAEKYSFEFCGEPFINEKIIDHYLGIKIKLDHEQKKMFLKTLLNILVDEESDLEDVERLISTCFKNGMLRVSMSIAKYLEIEDEAFFVSGRVDEELETEVDFAEDLLATPNKAKQVELYTRKIEKYLDSDDLEDPALDHLLEKLVKIDPESEIIKKYNELVYRKKNSSIVYQNKDDGELVKELIEEISKFTSREKLNIDENPLDKISIISSLRMMKNSELQDTMCAFVMAGSYETALEVSKVFDEREEASERERLAFGYMEGICLLELKKFYEAKDLVAKVIGSYPMSAEEKINFQYLGAEAFRSLGQIKEAVSLYKKIKKVNPKYRLVEQRLTEFERL